MPAVKDEVTRECLAIEVDSSIEKDSPRRTGLVSNSTDRYGVSFWGAYLFESPSQVVRSLGPGDWTATSSDPMKVRR